MTDQQKLLDDLKRFIETGRFTNRRPFRNEDFLNPYALIGRKVVPFDLHKLDTRIAPFINLAMILLDGVELEIDYVEDRLISGRIIGTKSNALLGIRTNWEWHSDWLLLVDE